MHVILIDCNCVCYRAHYGSQIFFHSDGTPTGVIYTFFNTLKVIAEQAQSSKFVFTWDSPISKRKQIYPEYKEGRKQLREKDPTIEDSFWQFDQLHEVILPQLGFVNNFKYDGYESDDIIARCCEYQDEGWDFTIVTTDKDMYQCLSPNVSILNPHKWEYYTYANFKTEFCGLEPEDYISIKAIAGCTSDNVKGIYGVGEKTCIKYLIDPYKKEFPKIDNPEAHKIIDRNWPLVELPFKGCPTPDIKFPKMDFQKWKEFIYEREFESFKKNNAFWQGIFAGKDPKGFTPPPKKWAGRGHRNG